MSHTGTSPHTSTLACDACDEYDDDAIVNTSPNPAMESILSVRLQRRQALKGGVGAAAATLMGGVGLSACGGGSTLAADAPPPAALRFAAVAKTRADQVTVPDGYQISILHALGDPMHWGDTSWSDQGTETPESYQRRIGCGHDGMYYFGLSDAGTYDANRSDRGLLCVNHEYVVAPYGLHPAGSTAPGGKRPASEVDKEIFAHGASVVEVRRRPGSTDMEMVRGSRYNRRITSATEMMFGGPAAGHARLVNKLSPDGTRAFGMNNNCACGYTPWGTYLTCEENYLNVIGRAAGDDAQRNAAEITALKRYGLPAGRRNPYRWDTPDGEPYQRWNSRVSAATAAEDHRNSFNTFGWVVEIDPFRPQGPGSMPVKRTALGRFNHEGAWPAPAVAGQPIVIYSGDDARHEYVYKFVSDALWDPADVNGGTAAGAKYLDRGTLYVARFDDDGTGEWLPLVHGTGGLDAANPTYPFADQGDVVMHCRLAADHLGATKMDRPEWGGVNPRNGEVYMTMTNNSRREADQTDAANPRPKSKNGHIIRWRENGGQAGTRFVWDIYLFGARADGRQDENLSGLGEDNDFSSPDGLYFDQRLTPDGRGTSGLLWIQTDDGAYTDVTNCMMLAALPGQVGDGGPVTTQGGQRTHMGARPTDATVRRFLVGPFDCEITGVVVTPDGKTLFFNVQHPGEDARAANFATNSFTSHWPGNQAPASDAAHHGHKRPRSATVVVTRTDGGVIAL